MISYGRQTIDFSDVEAVTGALTSEMITQGPLIEAFERSLAEYTGSKYAVCCSSGTAALHIAYLAAGVSSGDAVITSPNTFLATPNAALYAGATPVFADIYPKTGNIDPQEVQRAVEAAPRTKAIVPVHYAGLPADMEAIAEIAEKSGLVVIEDACHALGASVREEEGWTRVGACSRSLMTVFSFHPVKAMTTGEGGAVTTNDRETYERLKLLRSHGMTRDERLMEDKASASSPWYYEMHALGFNYRLTDIQAALGISQLTRLDGFVKRRGEIAGLYDELFAGSSFIHTPEACVDRKSAHHLYPVRVDFEGVGVSKAEFFTNMIKSGIRPQVHYIPVHLQPYYRARFGLKAGDFPNAERFYATEVSLPIYPLLTDTEVYSVKEAVLAALGQTEKVRGA